MSIQQWVEIIVANSRVGFLTVWDDSTTVWDGGATTWDGFSRDETDWVEVTEA